MYKNTAVYLAAALSQSQIHKYKTYSKIHLNIGFPLSHFHVYISSSTVLHAAYVYLKASRELLVYLEWDDQHSFEMENGKMVLFVKYFAVKVISSCFCHFHYMHSAHKACKKCWSLLLWHRIYVICNTKKTCHLSRILHQSITRKTTCTENCKVNSTYCS